MRKDKGVISVFLALIFGMLFTFFCTTIDITRINSAKNQLIVAADAAITSVLSDYDIDLYESYGIMTFDKSKVNKDAVKEIVDLNVTDNSLFNIDVEDVGVVSGGSPFTNNDIMKKQMIHSMKYQGTENLAMSVFEKLKEILNIKDIAADQEYIEKFEESNEKEELDYKISVIEQAKVDVHKAVLELAKNTTFNDLIKSPMSFIYNTVSKDMISNISNSNAVQYAINTLKNDESYKADKFTSYVHNIYSYKYTKMILEMYYEYSVYVHSNIQESNPDNEDSEEVENGKDDISNVVKVKTPKPEQIKAKISSIDNTFKNMTTSQVNSLISKLEKFQSRPDKKLLIIPKGNYGIEEGIEVLKDLRENNDKYIKLIDEYNDVKTEEAKESVKENVDKYKEILSIENLKSYEDEFNKVNNHINKVIKDLKMMDEMTNAAIGIGKEWAKTNPSNSLFTTLDDEFGNSLFITGPNDLVKKISQHKDIMRNSKVNEILKNEMYQVETLKGLSLSSNMKMDPKHKDADKFEKFIESFKEIMDLDGKDNSITAVIDRHIEARGTNYTIPKGGLPSNSPGESKSESLVQGLGNINSDDIKNLDNFGALLLLADKTVGGLLDNAYLVEYVMTNFKDMIGSENENRIPEVTTNDTKLGFEIEAIISGKYNDKSSSDAMVSELLLKRGGLNFISLSNQHYQKDINRFISRIAGIISTATQGVIPMPVIKYTLIGGWSALEARYDVIDLLNGKEVSILKKGLGQWVTDLGLTDTDFNNVNKDNLSGTIDNINLKNVNPNKKGEESYNIQGISNSLDYIDFVRLRLLTMDKDKLIDRCQDLIAANKNIKNYENYSTDLEISINKSNVNLIFNTPTFESSGGSNRFNSFSFKRGYN